MMEELKKNGPFVVSFETDTNFIFYKSGIYHSLESNYYKENDIFEKEFTKIDHSVLLVGWGKIYQILKIINFFFLLFTNINIYYFQ